MHSRSGLWANALGSMGAAPDCRPSAILHPVAAPLGAGLIQALGRAQYSSALINSFRCFGRLPLSSTLRPGVLPAGPPGTSARLAICNSRFNRDSFSLIGLRQPDLCSGQALRSFATWPKRATLLCRVCCGRSLIHALGSLATAPGLTIRSSRTSSGRRLTAGLQLYCMPSPPRCGSA